MLPMDEGVNSVGITAQKTYPTAISPFENIDLVRVTLIDTVDLETFMIEIPNTFGTTITVVGETVGAAVGDTSTKVLMGVRTISATVSPMSEA